MAMKLLFVFLSTATVVLLSGHHVTAQANPVNGDDPCKDTQSKDLCRQLIKNAKDARVVVDTATKAIEAETEKLINDVARLPNASDKEVQISLDILTDAREKFTMIFGFVSTKQIKMFHGLHLTALKDFERADEGYVRLGKPFPFLDRLVKLRQMATVCTDLSAWAFSK